MRTEFEVPGKPQGKGRPQFHNGRAHTPAKTREYEEWIRMHYLNQTTAKNRMHDGPLLVTIKADFLIPVSYSKTEQRLAAEGKRLPTKKPDLDNVIKCLDALNGVAWHDDAQIVGIMALKVYDSSAKVTIVIDELGEL